MTRRILRTSLSLPTAAQDYVGQVWYTREIGVDQICPWIAIGGASFVWYAQGPCYTGPLSGLPLAANVRIGSRAVIDQPAPGGLTRTPAAGVRMRTFELEVKLKSDGSTKSWFPRGDQLLFGLGGSPATPAISNYAATAATGVVSEFGQLPAGFLSKISAELYFRILAGRAAPNAGTATLVASITNPAGTLGVAMAAVAGVSANALAMALIDGSLWTQDDTHQSGVYTLQPNGTANVAASGVPLTQNLANAQTLQLSFTNATVGDVFNGVSLSVGIR